MVESAVYAPWVEKFLDENNQELNGCGEDLMKIRKIDLSGLNPLIKECKFTVMCDVTNPLLRKRRSYLYIRQTERCNPEIQNDLEAGMCNYRDIIKEQFDLDMDNIPGYRSSWWSQGPLLWYF